MFFICHLLSKGIFMIIFIVSWFICGFIGACVTRYSVDSLYSDKLKQIDDWANAQHNDPQFYLCHGGIVDKYSNHFVFATSKRDGSINLGSVILGYISLIKSIINLSSIPSRRIRAESLSFQETSKYLYIEYRGMMLKGISEKRAVAFAYLEFYCKLDETNELSSVEVARINDFIVLGQK